MRYTDSRRGALIFFNMASFPSHRVCWPPTPPPLSPRVFLLSRTGAPDSGSWQFLWTWRLLDG